MEQLRSIKFPDYSNYTCVNDAYQDFATNFLLVIDFLALIRGLRVKSNSKSWFDIDIFYTIRNHDKYKKKFKRSDKEIDKHNFKCAKLLLKKIINNKKKIYFEEISSP